MSNTANSCNIMAKWFLLIVVCCSVWPPHSTYSTPIKARSGTASHGPTHHKSPLPHQQQQQPCPHDSIGELIRSSPVILKALGARIFTDDDLNAFQRQQQLQQQQLQHQEQSKNTESNFVAAGVGGEASTMAGVMTTPSPAESILITLTPETIYKGASLLKVTPNAGGDAARSGAFAYSDAEAAYQYEGQLNATLQPFACFDNNVVKLLPSVLIAFGKLVTVEQQQHRQLFEPQAAQQQQQDVLHISINGLHRWSPQFEAHIWKHLGWDDWSDFTLCSVTCGKGVQQRFRRCLLDNPMMNLNMNMNFNNDDDDAVLVDEVESDGDTGADEIAQHVDEDAAVVNDWQQQQQQQQQSMQASQIGNANSGQNTPAGDEDISINGMNGIELREGHQNAPAAAAEDNVRGNNSNWRGAMAKSANQPLIAHAVDRVGAADESLAAPTASSTATAVAGIHNNMLLQDSNAATRLSQNEEGREDREDLVMEIGEDRVRTHRNRGNVDAQAKHKRKHRKAAKTLSTLFCEGYNIEQRNCNTFECSDDISDLLKFYKRLPTPYDDSPSSFSSQSPLPSTLQPANSSPPDNRVPYDSVDAGERRSATSPASFSSAPSVSSAGAGVFAANTTSSNMLFMATSSVASSTTPSNMGFIKFWHNSLNFTLMLTLRAKNDSRKASATIFSIRNATHNLYLESCEDGLRLYLERDNSTEMLPVKFNLFDYRWHQVAISIQNGDFISIYVDCSWTNSFVVSKRLFALPLDADVEIGRGFNGELQQILVLPDNQERHQCSSKRTSINEVKRYIIDTFIGDYTN